MDRQSDSRHEGRCEDRLQGWHCGYESSSTKRVSAGDREDEGRLLQDASLERGSGQVVMTNKAEVEEWPCLRNLIMLDPEFHLVNVSRDMRQIAS
jgi:hypothetical protein